MNMKNSIKRKDSLWSKAVKKNYKGMCPCCGSPYGSSHHIIPRDNRLTRWVIENGIYCCNEFHRAFEKYRGKKSQLS